LTLSNQERAELEALARSRRGRADESRRARIMLLLAGGYCYTAISERVACMAQTIATWKARYQAQGIRGLRGRHRHRGSKPRVLTPQVAARILSWTRKPPTDGTTHWSTRRLGDKLGLPDTIVARAWKRAGVQPGRWSATCDRRTPISKRCTQFEEFHLPGACRIGFRSYRANSPSARASDFISSTVCRAVV
jgi:transposase